MEWVSKRYYSINSIVRALNNVSENKADNEKFSVFMETSNSKDVVIVGGGPSVVNHQEAIHKYLSDNVHIPIIHASSKNARSFDGLTNEQFYCLAGNEGLRLEKVFEENLNPKSKCVLPPYPRKMGTYIPESVKGNTYEIDAIDFTEEEYDSHTAIALQTALNLGAVNVYLVGYDGYINGTAAKKDQELFLENTYLFDCVKSKLKLTSLLPTEYKKVENKSIYDLLK